MRFLTAIMYKFNEWCLFVSNKVGASFIVLYVDLLMNWYMKYASPQISLKSILVSMYVCKQEKESRYVLAEARR